MVTFSPYVHTLAKPGTETDISMSDDKLIFFLKSRIMASYVTSSKNKVHLEINTFKMIKIYYWVIAGIMLDTE